MNENIKYMNSKQNSTAINLYELIEFNLVKLFMISEMHT